MGLLVFYKGPNGTENIVHTIEDFPGQNFKTGNIEIRSVKLIEVREGCELMVFDSPDGSMNDDFCIIKVKKASPDYTVPVFDRTYEDEYVQVNYIRFNGFKEQVGRIKVN